MQSKSISWAYSFDKVHNNFVRIEKQSYSLEQGYSIIFFLRATLQSLYAMAGQTVNISTPVLSRVNTLASFTLHLLYFFIVFDLLNFVCNHFSVPFVTNLCYLVVIYICTFSVFLNNDSSEGHSNSSRGPLFEYGGCTVFITQ